MDAMKFATDMCDGKTERRRGTYQTSHSSVMGAFQTALEEVDRNHPTTLVVGARW